MAPLGLMERSTTMNVNDDEAFLSLLSSQRELLNRLNMESTTKKEQQTKTTVAQNIENNSFNNNNYSNNNINNKRKRGSIIGSVDPLSLVNTPISTQRTGLDMLFTQRLSIAFGGDFFAVPTADSTFSFGDEEKIRELDYADPKRMMRRRSSLGLLSSIIFDDHQRLPSRRLSMLSTLSGSIGLGDGFDQELSFENFDPVPISSAPTTVQLDPSIPSEIVRENLTSFATSMDKSTKSQQEIHAWDRKMGLKRSHSKTMRMTMRSRKKLRAMLKKDINAILQNGH